LVLRVPPQGRTWPGGRLGHRAEGDFRSGYLFNPTATTEIYTLSLHDALPISSRMGVDFAMRGGIRSPASRPELPPRPRPRPRSRSEEHTSELQSQSNIVCRLLLEKKKQVRPERYQTTGSLAPTACEGTSSETV